MGVETIDFIFSSGDLCRSPYAAPTKRFMMSVFRFSRPWFGIRELDRLKNGATITIAIMKSHRDGCQHGGVCASAELFSSSHYRVGVHFSAGDRRS